MANAIKDMADVNVHGDDLQATEDKELTRILEGNNSVNDEKKTRLRDGEGGKEQEGNNTKRGRHQ